MVLINDNGTTSNMQLRCIIKIQMFELLGSAGCLGGFEGDLCLQNSLIFKGLLLIVFLFETTVMRRGMRAWEVIRDFAGIVLRTEILFEQKTHL